MIRTSILVQFEPCNIGPRISPGLMVHNSNFSSSENNIERVSWEQGKSWEVSVIFPSVFFAYIKTKRTIFAVGGHLPYCTDLQCRKNEDLYSSKKEQSYCFFFFFQVSCWFSRKDQRASRTLEIKIQGLFVACCPTREFARRLAFVLQREFTRDMFELTW